jgi:creatinine amidohydrolase
MLLENLAWPETKQADVANQIVLLPLGSFEQHGPHLPFTTDSDLVTAVARGVECQRPEKILCLPTVWTGHSTHHLRFPGTLSVHQMPYIQLIVDLCEGIAGMGAKKVFLLNGHGGNDVPLRAALRELKSLHPGITFVFANYWSLAVKTIKQVRTSELGGIGHACELETSLMLHLHPDRVRMHLARRDGPGHDDPYRKTDMQYGRPVYMVHEFEEITTNGTIGHPDLATAEKGERFLNGIVSEVTEFVDAFGTWKSPKSRLEA